MVIGIDASRANIAQRTGTEWYAYHVISELIHTIPQTPEYVVRLYVKEPLIGDMPALPSNWEVVVLGWPPKLLWTQLRVSIEMLLHKPDVLYVPAHTIPLIHPKKTVTVIHDVGFYRNTALYNTSAIPQGRSMSKHLLNAAVRICTLGRYGVSEQDYHRFSFRRAVVGASDIITISQFSRKEILDIAPTVQPKLSVVYNGIRPMPQIDKSSVTEILSHYTLQQGEYVTTIGRIEEKKNSPFLIEVFAAMVAQGYKGKLVCIGKPGYGFERVEEAIAKHQLQERVICTGYVDDSTANALIQAARVFVLPSLYEGFGMPVLEAMQLQTPVVCSDIEVLREVAGDAAVFADPRNIQAWVDACMKVVQHTEVADALRARGVQRTKNFSWKATAEHTWRVLHTKRTNETL